MELFHKMISGFLGIPERQISSTLHLLGEGATIPFISRYRKEATGGLDEVQIEQIKEQHDKLCDIAKRKETILGTINEQGKLTAELEKRINDTWNPTELEDIYLPYKPKRKTRAEVARQKGLEPLATILMLQRENNLSTKAASFVKGDVKDVGDALKGARDIIAEQVNEDERARNAVRNQFSRQAEISAKVVKGKEEEAAKYRDYFDFSEALKRCTSHRLLAIRRAESEGLLKYPSIPTTRPASNVWNANSYVATTNVAGKWAKPQRMLTNGCSSLPSKQNLPPNPKRKPTMKQFAYSPKTSANFFSLRHWDKNGCSPSTPDSVPDVRLFVSTHKAICCIMRISIRILRSTRPARLLRNFAR